MVPVNNDRCHPSASVKSFQCPVREETQGLAEITPKKLCHLPVPMLSLFEQTDNEQTIRVKGIILPLLLG